MIKNLKFKIENSRKGFTFIELIVVIAIIGILAAIAIVNFGSNEDRDVRMEKERLTSFLREVQNKSLTGDKEGVAAGGKTCGFGVRQQAGTDNLETFYVSTADLNGDCNENWGTYAKTAYETFYPSKGVAFSLAGDIFFMAPNGGVLCDECALPIDVTVTKGGSTVNATIDAAGRIY